MILTRDRRDAFTALTACKAPEQALSKLSALDITSLEELQDHWTYGDRQLLLDYLGASPVHFLKSPETMTFARGRGASASSGGDVVLESKRLPVRHSRGLQLAPTQSGRRAASPQPVPATRKTTPDKAVSLISRFPAARYQDERGTCVAFASVALLEYHLYDDLKSRKNHSEQFVYWACKENDGIPQEDGTYIQTARKVLKEMGACLSKTWPYHPKEDKKTRGQGPPPVGAVDEAGNYLLKAVRKTSARKVQTLTGHLDAGRPVVIGVSTYASWDYPNVSDTGEIPMPLPGTKPDGGHAVCLVGYEVREGVPGGGVFIFRNSWGRQWARKEGRFGEGYGTLFFDYVRQNGAEAFYAKA
ncbi:MAG: C1 family peptidase [Planctomycetota bacterium]|nr:C1 family peptidase [Planctomycetota bacterium]